jgi:hypothetical protein
LFAEIFFHRGAEIHINNGQHVSCRRRRITDVENRGFQMVEYTAKSKVAAVQAAPVWLDADATIENP